MSAPINEPIDARADAQSYELATREILEARLDEGLSMSQIAHGAGVTATWLRAWRSGKISNPGLYTIGRLRQYLEILDA